MAMIEDAIATIPTALATSLLRGSEGAFGAPRRSGKSHQGVVRADLTQGAMESRQTG